MIIGKHFEFEAAHFLPDEEIYGKCANMHGHTYKLTVEVEGNTMMNDMVMNFSDLKRIVTEQVIKKYDHRVINDFIEVPTVENMLIQISADLRRELPNDVCLKRLSLYETSNNYALIEY